MAAQNYTKYEELSEPVKEAYNVLRTNIQFFELENMIKTITVTSYSPGEGKTTTAINIGIAMAKTGLKVLFVDADLRKPMLLKSLGSNDFRGLSNVLLGRAVLDEVIYSTYINNFYFIPCGVKPLNPTELLSFKKFSRFLESVREQFDIVIIDTPPLGSVIDCAIIAAQTDGTLIVVESGRIKSKNVQMVKEQLEKANARILGVVLNKLTRSDYKDYYSGYDYYGSGKGYAKGWLQKHKK